MRPVMAEKIVVLAQEHRKRRRNGFLPDAEVHRTSHLVGGMIFAGQRLLAHPQAQHEAQDSRSGFGLAIAYVDASVAPRAENPFVRKHCHRASAAHRVSSGPTAQLVEIFSAPLPHLAQSFLPSDLGLPADIALDGAGVEPVSGVLP